MPAYEPFFSTAAAAVDGGDVGRIELHPPAVSHQAVDPLFDVVQLRVAEPAHSRVPRQDSGQRPVPPQELPLAPGPPAAAPAGPAARRLACAGQRGTGKSPCPNPTRDVHCGRNRVPDSADAVEGEDGKMIRFTCPHCGRHVRVSDAHGGKKGRCPYCQQIVTIPTTSEVELTPEGDEVAELAAVAAATQAEETEESPPPPPPHHTEDVPTEQEPEPELVPPSDPRYQTDRLETLTEPESPPEQPEAPATGLAGGSGCRASQSQPAV